MAAEVGRLLDARGEPPLHVVGLSLGACVGLALALGAPARARSLTLVGGFARLRPGSAGGACAVLARVACLATAPMTAVAALAARAMFPKPEQANLYRAAVRSLARTPRRTYVAALAALAAFDARDRLARLRCPTLVVAGGPPTQRPPPPHGGRARRVPRAPPPLPCPLRARALRRPARRSHP